MFDCVHAQHSLNHYGNERYSGRCRMPRSLFVTEKAALGWIFHFRISISGSPDYEVLCTAWPHLKNDTERSCIVIDDSVFKGSKEDWVTGKCTMPSCNVGGDSVPPFLSTSPTGVVQSIVRALVFPLITMPRMCHPKQYNIHGILLTGPPGVGKSFAITAARELCEHICQIEIHNLSVPDALSSADPVRYVCDIFRVALTDSPELDSPAPLPHEDGLSQSSSFASATKRADRGGVPSIKSPLSVTPGSRFIVDGELRTGREVGLTSDPPSPLAFVSASTDMPTPDPHTTPARDGARRDNARDTSRIKNSPFSFSSQFRQTPAARSSSGDIARHSCVDIDGNTTTLWDSRHTDFSAGIGEISSGADVAGSISGRPAVVHVVMIDEIDSLGSGCGSSEEDASQEIVVKSLICEFLDTLATVPTRCAVIATSNRLAQVDRCFRRAGRLDKEIDVLESSEDDRYRLLYGLLNPIYPLLLKQCVPRGNDESKVWLPVISLQEDVEAVACSVASATGGYVAADLTALVREALRKCMSRLHTLAEAVACMDQDKAELTSAAPIFTTTATCGGGDESSNMSSGSGGAALPHGLQLREVLTASLLDAKSVVPPSCLRGDAVKIPKLSFDDIIGYDEVKVKLAKVLAFVHPDSRAMLQQFGISKGMGGVLLYGPPGNSKTRLVMAAASTYSLPVISLSVADVYSAYVGNAEAEIRRAFRLARQAHPCVLFLDELDALVTDRSIEKSSNNVESRVLASLLTEMDGIDGASSEVIVIAATNRMESIDAALLRKGRFHHLLHVPLPTMETKHNMVKYFGDTYSLSDTARHEVCTKLTDRMSGAEVENLCREKGMERIKKCVVQRKLYSGTVDSGALSCNVRII